MTTEPFPTGRVQARPNNHNAAQAASTWDNLFFAGSILDLDVSIWGARTKIRPQDLGIADSPDVRKALSLGSHRLLPTNAFDKVNEIASAAQRAVDYRSLNFAMIRGARYVPDSAIGNLIEELRGYQRSFNAAVEEFVAQYEARKAEMIPVIQKAIADAGTSTENAAVAINRIAAQYPSADNLRRKFNLSWRVYTISGAKGSAVASALADENESVKSVVRDMVVSLRTELAEKLAYLLKLVTDGGNLKGPSLKAAEAVLDRVDSMNILGDRALAAQTKALRKALAGVEAGKRVSDDFVSGLQTIQASLEGSLEEAVAAAEKNLTAVGRRKLSL